MFACLSWSVHGFFVYKLLHINSLNLPEYLFVWKVNSHYSNLIFSNLEGSNLRRIEYKCAPNYSSKFISLQLFLLNFSSVFIIQSIIHYEKEQKWEHFIAINGNGSWFFLRFFFHFPYSFFHSLLYFSVMKGKTKWNTLSR